MTTTFSIAGRTICDSEPPFVIAEISGNHNGEIERAFRLVDAAKQAGADAVKFQTYTADTITIDHHGPGFVIEGGLWNGRSLYDLYREAHTPWDWHPALFEHARQIGIIPFSSPFDPTAVDLLESLDAPAYKIASFEIVDIPLIEYAAATGKPLIVSTGMASDGDVSDAVEAIGRANAPGPVLLHCVSGYPTPAEEANLPRMARLRASHGVLVGLSDHTLGNAVAVAAAALGAVVIEKHVTLDRAGGGPDAEFSLEPDELAALVRDVRAAHAAMHPVPGGSPASEQPNTVLRRSLYVVADILAGDVLTEDNVRSIRPGHGLAPRLLPHVLGARATANLKRGTPLEHHHVSAFSETEKGAL